MSSTAGLTATGFVTPTLQALLTSVNTKMQALISPTLDLSDDQPFGQINGLHAQMYADLWGALAALYSVIDPNQAEGVQLDNVSALTGTLRPGAKATVVTCSLTFTASTTLSGASAYVVGNSSQLFTLQGTVYASSAGTITGTTWVANDTGPIVVNENTLTQIASPVAGWASITNPLPGTTGQNAYSDTALRVLRQQEIAQAGSNTADSLRAKLLLVPGIISAYVYQNLTDTSYTAPTLGASVVRLPHSFEAVIYDGPSPAASNSTIATTVWEDQPSGIPSVGSTSATVEDEAGVQQTVNFTRATVIPLYAAVTITLDDSVQYAGDAVVTTAIAASLTASQTRPGKEVVAFQLRAAALVPGVLDVPTFLIDTSATPVNSGNLFPLYSEVYSLDPSNISVTYG